MRARSALARRASVATAAFALALAAGGCGGEDEQRPESVPAAGENAPTGTATPGVPPGAPYDVDGVEWERLRQTERFAAAQAYIDDNPARCEGAQASDVAFYVTNSYGFDFPPDIPASEVLAEGCDADRQS